MKFIKKLNSFTKTFFTFFCFFVITPSVTSKATNNKFPITSDMLQKKSKRLNHLTGKDIKKFKEDIKKEREEELKNSKNNNDRIQRGIMERFKILNSINDSDNSSDDSSDEEEVDKDDFVFSETDNWKQLHSRKKAPNSEKWKQLHSKGKALNSEKYTYDGIINAVMDVVANKNPVKKNSKKASSDTTKKVNIKKIDPTKKTLLNKFMAKRLEKKGSTSKTYHNKTKGRHKASANNNKSNTSINISIPPYNALNEIRKKKSEKKNSISTSGGNNSSINKANSITNINISIPPSMPPSQSSVTKKVQTDINRKSYHNNTVSFVAIFVIVSTIITGILSLLCNSTLPDNPTLLDNPTRQKKVISRRKRRLVL